MSATQRFLVEASRAAGTGCYFRWQAVGSSLGISAAESERTMRSLDERKLVILLLDGDARLLDAGRRLAEKTGDAAPGDRSNWRTPPNRNKHGQSITHG